MKLYALRHIEKQKLMGFCVNSNEGLRDCGSTATELEISRSFRNENIWVVMHKEIAEKAAVTDTPWYIADMATPQNGFLGQLEVVELVLAEELDSLKSRIYNDECGVPT